MFIKFCFVSLLSNLLGYFIFTVSLLWSNDVNLSLGVAYLVHFFLSQIMNVFFVFNKSIEKIKPIFINFLLYIFLYFLNVLSINYGLYFHDFDIYYFQFFFMIIIIMLNYFFQRYLYLILPRVLLLPNKD